VRRNNVTNATSTTGSQPVVRTSRSATSINAANHDQQNKLQSEAIGHFVIVDADADASPFVIDIDGEEKRVSSDHVTPAPRPTTTDTVPHPLLDGQDQRKTPPATADEYVIDKLLGFCQTGDTESATVRWFDYGWEDDTWEPLKNLPRNMAVHFLRQKKKHVMLIPEFCPGRQRLTRVPTLSTNQMRPWD